MRRFTVDAGLKLALTVAKAPNPAGKLVVRAKVNNPTAHSVSSVKLHLIDATGAQATATTNTQGAYSLAVKGMTLPFISYGGSSMVSLAYGVGMLLALTRLRPRTEVEAIERGSAQRSYA